MKDIEHVLPLLHRLDRPTFITRDLGLFDHRHCHQGYSIVCLAVSKDEVARFARAVLRHRAFNSKAKQMGTIIRAGAAGLLMWRSNTSAPERVSWKH